MVTRTDAPKSAQGKQRRLLIGVLASLAALLALLLVIDESAAFTPSVSFGSAGSGEGQFRQITDMAVAPNGDVYVTDFQLNRVQRFSKTGSFLGSWSHPCPQGISSDTSGVYVGSLGNENGPLSNGGVTCFGVVAKYDFTGSESWSLTGLNYPRDVASDGTTVYFHLDNQVVSRYLASSGASAGANLSDIGTGLWWNSRIAPRLSGGFFSAGQDDQNRHRIAAINPDGSVSSLSPVVTPVSSLASDGEERLFTKGTCDPPGVAINLFSPSLSPVETFIPQSGLCAGSMAVSQDGSTLFLGEQEPSNTSARRVVGFDLYKPEVTLAASTETPLTGESVTLSATAAVPVGGVRSYEWDLDNNGSFTSGSATESTSFDGLGSKEVTVRAKGARGDSAEAKITLDVRPAPPSGEVGISINNGDIATNSTDVALRLVWPKLSLNALISNDGGFSPSESVAVEPQVSWKLRSSGPERQPRIVYVRFRGWDDSPITFTDDIILDERPPEVIEASGLAGPSSSTRTLRKRKARVVRVQAKDSNSGVATVSVSRKPRGKAVVTKRLVKPGKLGKRKQKASIKVPKSLKRAFVRVTDVAGNSSRPRRVK